MSEQAITPSNESVVAHLQERLREAWVKSPTYPNQEVYDVLDAIRTCLKADGWPDMHWCGACHAWHEYEKHVVEPAIRERIVDFIGLWFGLKTR